MKVHKLQNICEFTPFNVILTVESEEEARALYAIFNYSSNLDLFPGNAAGDVRHTIGRKFSDTVNGEIANGVTHGQFYSSKRED